jgi:adenylate kinase
MSNTKNPPHLSTSKGHEDLEIKDAQFIFRSVWRDLEKKVGKKKLRFPKEIIWLGGAPGSGKGTNTAFIMQERDINANPIVMSALLNSPQAQKIKDVGGMVGDREVVAILYEKLLEKEYENGAVVDGFPRTKVQVECLKQLSQKMIDLRTEYLSTALRDLFPQPIFRAVLLFVEEYESVRRQLKRGNDVRAHNKRVRESGLGGSLLEERVTDFDKELAKNRYRVFKEKTYDALQSLRDVFHYHFIDASVKIPEVEKNIAKELQYQSSLELDHQTYDRIRRVPLAESIVVHARQALVRRLDSYEFEHKKSFQRVLGLIEETFIPIVMHHAISGEAKIFTEDSLLADPLARQMLIDVFSERGYHAVMEVCAQEEPDAFDPKTKKILRVKKNVYHIQIKFPGCEIRRGH